MPLIKVELLKGRSVDEKRKMAKALAETYAKTWSETTDGVHVMFDEREYHNWSIGGTLFCDRDT